MKCFVIMPFKETFDPVFSAIKDVACSSIPEANFECYWLKDVHAAGRITDDIITGLSGATFCIADLSGNNPNVMWETGYAMALGKPTILIGQDVESLPFDLKSHRVLSYSPGDTTGFRLRLAKAIRDTLSKYELKGSGLTGPPSGKRSGQMTIAVTGTMSANEAAVLRRIETLLSPYLSETACWLVGSEGTVDIATARFLVERRQKVTAVGYNRFDCAGELRPLVEEGKLSFLDAAVEPIPKRMSGPSERDILFCIKSDLVVLFWDGKSAGTREMVSYFQDQGVSTLLAFI
jgi:hypothetical protein